jgi:hypothetical protein
MRVYTSVNIFRRVEQTSSVTRGYQVMIEIMFLNPPGMTVLKMTLDDEKKETAMIETYPYKAELVESYLETGQ